MWGVSQLNPDKWLLPLGMSIFIISILAMTFMHVLPASMVTEAGGARRWIRLPFFSLAPVEFFKIGFIYFLAWSFTRKIKGDKITLREELGVIWPYVLLFLIVVYLIAVLQNDLGQVIVLALTLAFMVLYAGTSLKFFSLAILGGVIIFVTAVVTSDHRIYRIKSWWGGIQDIVFLIAPQKVADVLRVQDAPEPYQISHSLNAIKHGGLFGEGLGGGTFKLGFLSEVHTDFVLAGIAEEVGILGVICLAFIMLTIIFRIFKISSRSTNKVYFLFSLGIGLMVGFSFLMNSFGITSITPIKGIAVPLLSYGGSSLLATSLAIGMVLMVSKRADLK